MATMSVLQRFLFAPPPSLFVTAMSVVSAVSLAVSGFEEVRGKHMNYSKFWNVNKNNNNNATGLKKIKLSSKTGMLLLYTPAFFVGAASFWIFPIQSFRSTLLQSAVTLHFFKRVVEVLFVHKYSGYMTLEAAIPITLSYTLAAVTMIYAQHLTLELPEPSVNLIYPGIVLFLVGVLFVHKFSGSMLLDAATLTALGYFISIVTMLYALCSMLYAQCFTPELPEPPINLMYLGIVLFLIGISGNFYHYFLLSKLRRKGEKDYKIPKGCVFYLLGRSYATKRWYLSKFEDFPKDVKALIPFVF